MRSLWRFLGGVGRFFASLRVEDPAGDRVVAGEHARHLHAGLYSTPRPPHRDEPHDPGQPPH